MACKLLEIVNRRKEVNENMPGVLYTGIRVIQFVDSFNVVQIFNAAQEQGEAAKCLASSISSDSHAPLLSLTIPLRLCQKTRSLRSASTASLAWLSSLQCVVPLRCCLHRHCATSYAHIGRNWRPSTVAPNTKITHPLYVYNEPKLVQCSIERILSLESTPTRFVYECYCLCVRLRSHLQSEGPVP